MHTHLDHLTMQYRAVDQATPGLLHQTLWHMLEGV